MTLVVRNARLATMTGPQPAAGVAPLGIIEDGAVACDGDRIAYVGRTRSAPGGDQQIDAHGALLTPGLVDPHTHLIFAGDRAHEHALRLAGKTYLEIAHAGGGILSTVRATRAASDEQLLAGARERLARMVRSGVINRQGRVRIIREGVEVFDGTLNSLKRFKDDVKEVREGFECGIVVENYNDLKVGDVIECYRTEEFARTLGLRERTP